VVLGAFFLVFYFYRNYQIFSSAQSTQVKNDSLVVDSISNVINQKPLSNPPDKLRGIYITRFSAGTKKSIDSLLSYIKSNGLNAAVIDIKDYSGYLTYKIDEPIFNSDGANGSPGVSDINNLIKLFHDNDIYVIGRITVFEDPVLAKAYPQYALKTSSGALWKDNLGLSWVDPACENLWSYYTQIAQDASLKGFDEINFDYVRFASDGNLSTINFPCWKSSVPKAEIIKNFFAYLRKNLPNIRLSVDLFGQTTVVNNDMGIGQLIEDAFPYFNYIDPMTYPSLYISGFDGFSNPANHPYEVINFSLKTALLRLINFEQQNNLAAKNQSSTSSIVLASSSISSSSVSENFILNQWPKIRPWLQDFDLSGINYNASMVENELRATYDSLDAPSGSAYGGFLLWSPSNNYTSGINFNNP